MERLYRTMYRFGVTPWDNEQIPSELTRRIEGPGGLRPGVALDLGCGTGGHATYLADHGWEVTGIDVVPRAIARARSRSDKVRWEVADLTGESIMPVQDHLRGRVILILDVGCLHGLSDSGRVSWGETVNAVAASGASMLIRAISSRTQKSVGPRGIDPEDVARLLGEAWVQVGDPGSSDWAEYRKVSS